ncbi:TM0106 family RecB-like putative nuclease [Mesorhizobium sp.]|uniref:TM0106 family RecB-like putative nuclease n=1 Tax=Mesorhizobium sp. TaxID=1871066 RepID=UPI000FE489C0|nr:TM0106 family RecB-like putative nuclease [Mesorhizobium sp.]RWK54610.1 MAG: TM0106 family RecB-like putative nuclease [Mesorhizobium sp.]TIP45063.1 MAG: TM0106 family RecB-like putative nuclease [Mesorhizobium sp.]
MACRITDDVINALQHCRSKAYFRLRGEQGVKCGYEKLLIEQRANAQRNAIEKIRREYKETEVATELKLCLTNLRKRAALILSARLDDDRHEVVFDGLRKTNGHSTLGDFQYQPVMFCAAGRVRASDRQQLAARAVLLARVQGAFPGGGVVYIGRDSTKTGIRFGSTLTTAENLLRDAERLQRAEGPPKLLLNDHCHICEFRNRCRDQAIREDNLSLLRGVGEKTIKRYARKGVLTLTQLAHTFRPRRRGKRADAPLRLRDHALHALAIRDQTIYVLGAPKLPTASVRIYLDIEGVPEEGFTYLIGLVVCDGERVERHSLWSDDRKGEAEIFARFLTIVGRYDAPRIYCYGNYESSFIARMRRQARRKRSIDAVLATLTNVLTVIYPHFYFPTYSNGLKEVAGCLGCRWTEPDASGIESVVWRKNWEKTGDAWWKTKLIEYNLDDCEALRRVSAFLSEPLTGGTESKSGILPRVAAVAQLDNLARTVTWSQFAHADFAFINKRAYFDYQKRHVFIRTKPVRRTRGGKTQRRKWQNRELRATHRMEITATRCPFCKGKHITSIDPKQRPKGLQTRRKRAFDLVITPGAIRRKVIEFRAVAYHCTNCERCFTPERYERLARHFHNFMSWFAYQHITHRLGVKSLGALFYEIFGIRVNWWEFLAFRHLLVRRYRKTFNMLLTQLITGPVLHIDETEVKLKDGSGYVWVLASESATIYIFRRSREGHFLRKMLKDFKGVIVTDFYAAYDGLPCLPQRCLIHLMRDMNRAILDNPFDQELQSITVPFGALLRSIVVTVDEHGLKRKYLRRHARAVAAFFDALAEHTYESDVSKTLQERLLHNRERLFTFLQHDGVSWNNNLAENAIKRISDYREDVGRSVKESGLTEQLVLLSIYQTCRVRDLSFLKFLLSRERDMDAFAANKHRRRRPSRIELYPKGFLPSSILSLRRERVARVSDTTVAEAK